MNPFDLPIGIDAQKFVNKSEFTSPNHSHPYYEFLFIRHASFNYLVGNRIVEPTDHSLILVNINTVHKAVYANCENNSYLIFKFNENIIDHSLREHVQQLFRNPLLVLGKEDSSLVEFLIGKLYREFQQKDIHYESALAYLLNELMIYLHRSFQHQRALTRTKMPSTIEQAIIFLSENLFSVDPETISLPNVAERFHMSPSSFSRQFKKEAGMGFKQFIISLRIGRAKTLLTSTDAPISEIAMQCGFSDSNYFAYAFKKAESISPTDYAKYFKKL